MLQIDCIRQGLPLSSEVHSKNIYNSPGYHYFTGISDHMKPIMSLRLLNTRYAHTSPQHRSCIRSNWVKSLIRISHLG